MTQFRGVVMPNDGNIDLRLGGLKCCLMLLKCAAVSNPPASALPGLRNPGARVPQSRTRVARLPGKVRLCTNSSWA
jgi:hypothetical protein